MITLTPFRVNPKSMHELIIMPEFADVLDENGDVTQPSDEEGDWMVMDNVVTSRPIIDLFGSQNILKRRDQTCKLIYSTVGRLGAREIHTTKVYAAVEDCTEEFYQGAFADYESENFDQFASQVMPLMSKAVATDLYTNRYFGDTSRISDPAGVWSWNRFDGVFTQISKYITAGVIPSSQTFAIAGGAITPAAANTALDNAYNAQGDIMENMNDEDKCFYVDKKLAEAYHDYLVQSGVTVLSERMSGKPILYKKGILVKVKKWNPTLKSLNSGTEAHAIILTLKGNFVYGADTTYGGGPKHNEAIRIWYSMDDDVWRRQIHLKSGTEIAAPQFIVLGLTSF